MATISERITNIIRVDISDELQSRYSDTQLLTFFKQAIRRAQAVGFENQLSFARTILDFTVVSPDTSYLLPPSFLVQAGVWRTDTKKPIRNTTIEQWETLQGANEFTFYNIDLGDQNTINFASGSNNDLPVRIRYYFDVFPDNLILSSSMPWNGRFDYAICEYVNLRAFHVDRYDLSADLGLLQDMESKIIKMFVHVDPTEGQALGGFYL